MGELFFIGCAAILCIGILKFEGASRLICFFIGILFFQNRILFLETPTEINFHRLITYALFVAEFSNFKQFCIKFKSFPLYGPLLIVLIGFILIGTFDFRNNAFLNIYRVVDEFIKTFFVLFLCYASVKRRSDVKSIFIFFLISSVLFCLYGSYIYLTRSNPYDNIITDIYGTPSYFDQYALSTWEERFRVNSFVSHPITYGFILSVFLIISFYYLYFERNQAIAVLLVMTLIFFNLILTNSRTPLIITVLGFIIFIFFVFNSKIKIQLLIFMTFISFIAYSIPLIKEKVDNTIDVFETGGSKVSGSSIEMRNKQLLASYRVFEKSPIFGNGFKYISEDLGFKNVEENTADSEFEGFESYIYVILIEQGLTGILTNLVFFISIGYFFIIRRLVSIPISMLGLSILIMFLTFSFSTGTLGSWEIAMGIMGMLIKKLELSKSSVPQLKAINPEEIVNKYALN